jgi:hypothetical protein
MATISRSKSTKSSRSGGARASKGGTKSKSPGKSRRGSGKRELVSPNADKRFVRRGASGRFKESDDVSRSLSRDRRSAAKTKSKSGYGDRGDR